MDTHQWHKRNIDRDMPLTPHTSIPSAPTKHRKAREPTSAERPGKRQQQQWSDRPFVSGYDFLPSRHMVHYCRQTTPGECAHLALNLLNVTHDHHTGPMRYTDLLNACQTYSVGTVQLCFSCYDPQRYLICATLDRTSSALLTSTGRWPHGTYTHTVLLTKESAGYIIYDGLHWAGMPIRIGNQLCPWEYIPTDEPWHIITSAAAVGPHGVFYPPTPIWAHPPEYTGADEAADLHPDPAGRRTWRLDALGNDRHIVNRTEVTRHQNPQTTSFAEVSDMPQSDSEATLTDPDIDRDPRQPSPGHDADQGTDLRPVEIATSPDPAVTAIASDTEINQSTRPRRAAATRAKTKLRHIGRGHELVNNQVPLLPVQKIRKTRTTRRPRQTSGTRGATPSMRQNETIPDETMRDKVFDFVEILGERTVGWKNKKTSRSTLQTEIRCTQFLVRWAQNQMTRKELQQWVDLGYEVDLITPFNENEVKVDWRPSWEDAKGYTESPLARQAVREMREKTNAWTQSPPHVTLATGDGPGKEKHIPPPLVNLSIITEAVNPERDFTPPMAAQGRPFFWQHTDECTDRSTPKQSALVQVHDGTGRLQGTIKDDRLEELGKYYKGPDFTADILSLVRRYAPLNKHRRDTSKITCTRMEWCTPPPLMFLLAKIFDISHELFAHPMNHSSAIPHYWTPYRADEKFGAHFDAYSWAWLGACLMNPEYSEEELYKSVRWALEAVRQRKVPTFIIAILPRNLPNEKRPWSYTRLLQDPQVALLASLEKGTGAKGQRFSFLSSDEWATGENKATGARFDTDIYIISNTEGFNLARNRATQQGGAPEQDAQGTWHLTKGKLWEKFHSQFRHVCRQQGWQTPTAHTPTPPGYKHKHPIKAFRRVDWKDTKTMRYKPFPPPKPTPTRPPKIYTEHLALRFNSHRMVSVDGSKIQGTCSDEEGKFTVPAGAGIYFPNYSATDDPTGYPRAIGYHWIGVQDVPRAELIAVREAVREAIAIWDRTEDDGKRGRLSKPPNDVYIFSDSMAVLYGLRKHLRYPQQQHLHQYIQTFEEIIAMIQNSNLNFVICKVPAHAGIRLNDWADYAAKWGWRGSNSVSNGAERYLNSHPKSPFLKEWDELQSHTQLSSQGTKNVDHPPGGVEIRIPPWFQATDRPDLVVAYNVEKNLKAHLRANSLYQPPTVSRWAERFEDSTPKTSGTKYLTKLLRHKSNMLLQTGKATRKQVFRLLHNLFQHNGLANRNAGRQIVTPFCPICPNPSTDRDSGGHMLCACKHTVVENYRCARHQRGVRRIAQEILRSITAKDTLLIDSKKEDRDYNQLMDELDELDEAGECEETETDYVDTPNLYYPTPDPSQPASAYAAAEETERMEEATRYAELLGEDSEDDLTDEDDPTFQSEVEDINDSEESDSDTDEEGMYKTTDTETNPVRKPDPPLRDTVPNDTASIGGETDDEEMILPSEAADRHPEEEIEPDIEMDGIGAEGTDENACMDAATLDAENIQPEEEREEEETDQPMMTRSCSIRAKHTTHSLRSKFNMLTGYKGREYADLALFHGATFAMDKPINLETRRQIDITLLDFTYVMEYPENLTASYEKKDKHYHPMKAHLIAHGFKSVLIIPIVAGVRGWNPEMCRTELKRLHLTSTRCQKTLNYFTRNAWNSIRAIVGARRGAERSPEHKHKSGLHATSTLKKYARAYQR